MRMQAEFRLNELRREASHHRLAQSVQRDRRSFGDALRGIVRRGWRREDAAGTGAVRPLPGVATIEAGTEATRRVA